MMSLTEFLATPAHLAAIRDIVLQVQREIAPEEVAVTSSFVDPLIDLVARGELPTADFSREAFGFGAATDLLLLPIVSAVVGVLQTRIEAGKAFSSRELWEVVGEAEIQPLVLRTKSAKGRQVVAQLTRSLQRAFSRHLAISTAAAKEELVLRELRHTDISCPGEVWKGTQRFHLVVRLTPEPSPWSVAIQSVEVDPEVLEVQVDLQAPAFEVLNAPRQEITLLPNQDSTPAVFDLRPRELGHQRLTVDFFQDGHPLGMVGVSVKVTEQPVPEVQVQVPAASLAIGSDAPPPDRVLRLSWHQERSSLQVSLLQAGGSSWQDFAPSPMRDPAAYVELLFKDFDIRGSDPATSAKAVEERLKRVGQNLWRMLPEAFRSLYAREREAWRDTSLLLYSDEPHLPWELIWPYGEGWEDPDPWCLTLRLSRWLRRDEQGSGNPGAPGVLPLSNIAFVAPEDSGLAATARERAFLRQLFGPLGVRDVSPVQSDYEAVMELLRSQIYDWLHVSAHGTFSAGLPDQSSTLWLEEHEAITPHHLVGPEIEDHLRRVRPAFFFNACQAGRLGWNLTGLGGWAARLIACGAGMFLGPLADVEDETALLMAISLYRTLLNGEPIAEAVRQARQAVRNTGNPAWLAYCLYAHPNAKVRVGPQLGTSELEPSTARRAEG